MGFAVCKMDKEDPNFNVFMSMDHLLAALLSHIYIYLEKSNKNTMYDNYLYDFVYLIRRDEYQFGTHLCEEDCNAHIKTAIEKNCGLQPGTLTVELIKKISGNPKGWGARITKKWKEFDRVGAIFVGKKH